MNLKWGLYLALLAPFATPAVAGSIIDLSAKSTALVRTGDTLVFHLLTSSFAANAALSGLPTTPEDVQFNLAADSLCVLSGFSATLRTEEGNVAVAFDSLIASTGDFQGSAYQGPATTLQGNLHLSDGLSTALFSGPSAVLTLQNLGQDVTVGLSSYLLRQDLFASLSGGPLTVGAVPVSVELTSRDPAIPLLGFRMPLGIAPAVASVPEPASAILLFGGVLLLCGISLAARASRFRV